MARSNEATLILRLEARTKQMEKSMQKMEAKLGGSTNRMNKKWAKGMSRMERRATKFGKNVGAGIGIGLAAGTAAFVVFTKKALQSADDLQHFSEQVGISAEKLQEYTFVASRLGLSQEAMNKAFKVATANVGEFAATGTGEAAQAIKDMGLEQDILSGKLSNTGDILDILIERLGDETNALKRTGMAAEIFGKRNGAQLSEMLGLGTKAINDMKKEARDLGVIMDNEAVAKASAANDALGKLGDTIRGNLTRAIVELSPEIEQLANDIIEQIPTLVEWFTKAVGKVDEFGAALRRLQGKQPKIDTPEGANDRVQYIRRLAQEYRDYVKIRTKGERGLAQLEKQYPKGTFGGVDSGMTAGKTYKGIKKRLDKAKAEMLDEINSNFDKDVLLEFTVDGVVDIDGLLRAQHEAAEKLHAKLLKPPKPITPSRRSVNDSASGSTSSGSGISTGKKGLTDAQKQHMKAWQEAMAIEQQILVEQLNEADALYQAAQTPIEEYKARLRELSAVEGDVFMSDAAGGAETFARLRIAALEELASSTGDYELALKQLNELQTQGKISAEDAIAAKDAIDQSTLHTHELIEKKLELLDVQAREIEQELILAELRGNEEEIRHLERKLAIIRETMDVIARGGNPDTAEKSAEDWIDAQDKANIEGQIRDAAKGAFRAAIDGEFGDYLADKLSNAADKMFDRAIDSLLDVLFNQIDLGGLFKGGGSGGFDFSSIGNFFAGLFDGGGVIGAQKVGIVGERGPELIKSGSAPIRVMGRQATKRAMSLSGGGAGAPPIVIQGSTYNISGVDTQQAFAYADKKSREAYSKSMRDVDRRTASRRRGFAS